MALKEGTGYGFTPEKANEFITGIKGYYNEIMGIFNQNIQKSFIDNMEYGWFTPVAVTTFQDYVKVFNTCKNAMTYHYNSVVEAVNAAGNNWASNPYVNTTWSKIPFEQDDSLLNSSIIKESIDGQFGGDMEITNTSVQNLDSAKEDIINKIKTIVSTVDNFREMFIGADQVNTLKNSLESCGNQINSEFSRIEENITSQVKAALQSLQQTAEQVKSSNLTTNEG